MVDSVNPWTKMKLPEDLVKNVLSGDLEAIQTALINEPSLIGAVDEDERGLLHHAVLARKHAVLNWLLDQEDCPITAVDEVQIHICISSLIFLRLDGMYCMWLHLLAISSLSLRFFAILKDIVLSMPKMKRVMAHCTMHPLKAIFK